MKNKKKLIVAVIGIFLVLVVMFFFIINNYTRNTNSDKIKNIITTQLKSMKNRHVLHTATLLDNGNVLIQGGFEGYNNAEIYNFKKKTFKYINNNISLGLGNALLLKNGHLLIIGYNIIDYNPKNNSFTIKIKANKTLPKLLLLDESHIFIYAGMREQSKTNISEYFQIYDLSNNTLKSIDKPKKVNTKYIEAKLLPNNNILLFGNGFSIIYNYKTNKFLNYRKIDISHIKTTSIKNNKNEFLILYSSNQGLSGRKLGYYNPSTNNVTQVRIKEQLYGAFEVVEIPNKKLLLIGVAEGLSPQKRIGRAIYLFNANDNTMKKLGNMKYYRAMHRCTLLNDNQTVLITGGTNTIYTTDALNTAELLIVEEK